MNRARNTQAVRYRIADGPSCDATFLTTSLSLVSCVVLGLIFICQDDSRSQEAHEAAQCPESLDA